MKKCYRLAMMVGLLAPGALYAADQPVVTMDEVVVTATRQEEALASVPAKVTVITREEIERSTAGSIPDLFKIYTGIHAVELIGNGTAHSVDLRGFGETAKSNTLVLVDGRKVNQPDLSGTDWTLIPLEQVERIEVIHGGRASVLYGDNASAGVINIITRKAKTRESLLSASAGSYGALGGSVATRGAAGTVGYSLYGGYRQADGYRDNSEMDAADAGVDLDFSLSDAAGLSLATGYHKLDTGLPGALKESELAGGFSRQDTTHPDDFSETEDAFVKAAPELFFGDLAVFRVETSFRNRKKDSFASGDWGTSDWNTETDTFALSPQLQYNHAIASLSGKMTLGYDFSESREDIDSVSAFPGWGTFNNVYRLEKKNYGYYLHENVALTKAVSLSGGYRHDRAEYRFFPSDPATASMDKHGLTAGLNYRFAARSNLYANFSQSFRYPLLDELFNYASIDTTLVPQESDDYETGVRHAFPGDLFVSFAVYRINTEREIFFNPQGGPFGFGANENLDGRTRREGLECTIEKRFGGLLLYGNYTLLDAEISSGQYEGSEIPGVPKHKVAAGGTYGFDNGFSVGLNSYYVGERRFEGDFANTVDDQDDHVVVNTRVQYEGERVTTFAGVNNLLNEEFAEYGVLSMAGEKAYYPSLKMNFVAGLTCKF